MAPAWIISLVADDFIFNIFSFLYPAPYCFKVVWTNKHFPSFWDMLREYASLTVAVFVQFHFTKLGMPAGAPAY